MTNTSDKSLAGIDTSDEACERACALIGGYWHSPIGEHYTALDDAAALIRALCAERDEACTGNEILKAKLSALCEAVVVNDSYGVEGSSFQTCLACGAGGAPGIVFEHTTDCAVGRSEEVSERWFKERSDELKEYEDEEKRLLARAEAAESELSSLRAKGAVSEEAIARAIRKTMCAGREWPNKTSIVEETAIADYARAVHALLQSAPQDAKLPAPMEGEVAKLVKRLGEACRCNWGGHCMLCDAATALESASRRNEGGGEPVAWRIWRDCAWRFYESRNDAEWFARKAYLVQPLYVRKASVPPPETAKETTPPGPFVGDPGYRSGGDEAAKLHDCEMTEVRHSSKEAQR